MTFRSNRLSDEFLEEAVEDYVELQRWEEAPLRALAESRGVQYVTANRWMNEARRRGFEVPHPHRGGPAFGVERIWPVEEDEELDLIIERAKRGQVVAVRAGHDCWEPKPSRADDWPDPRLINGPLPPVSRPSAEYPSPKPLPMHKPFPANFASELLASRQLGYSDDEIAGRYNMRAAVVRHFIGNA